MNSEVGKAYELLEPKDQLVVDAMIIALYQNDQENRKLWEEAMKQCRRANDLELRLSNSESGD